MHLGFGILLGDEVHNFARETQLELCHKFGLCWGLRQSPHITVKGPFETNRLKPFLDYIDRLAAQYESFPIELEGFNYFEGEKNVVFLDVKETHYLKSLQNRIIEDMRSIYGIGPNAIELSGYNFHSTIAVHDVGDDALKQAKEYLSGLETPSFRFMAKRIAVFYYLGECGYVVVRQAKLPER